MRELASSVGSLAIAALGALLTAGCGSSNNGGGSSNTPPGTVLDPTQSHYGNTDDEWGALWWKWMFELPQTDAKNCVIPFQDSSGASCAVGQMTSDVFFLAGTTGGTVVRDQCAVPTGKPLLFPIATFSGDNAGVPVPMQLTDPQLIQAVTMQVDSVTGLSASFDGTAIPNLSRFRTNVTKFAYNLPPEPNFDTCEGAPGVTGSVPDSYASGYYVMLSPPAAGAHTLQFAATFPDNNGQPVKVDVTYKFTIH
jgi:hypothetical protein